MKTVCALALALMANYQQATFNDRFGKWGPYHCPECRTIRVAKPATRISHTRKQSEYRRPLNILPPLY